MQRNGLIAIMFLSVFIISCSTTKFEKSFSYGTGHGNPLCMSDEDLKTAIDDAMNGNYSKCNEIAFHYESLENGGDMVRCVYWLLYGAEHGDSTCMWNLGCIFSDNLKDPDLGTYWLNLAAENGVPYHNAVNLLESK